MALKHTKLIHNLLMQQRQTGVCGINEVKIQWRLLQEVNLTFENALQIARAMETAANNSLQMQQGGLTLTANQAPVAAQQT